MKLDELDYQLPAELIAERPAAPRDACRLMVVRRGDGTVTHHVFRDLPRLLSKADLLVLNSARVTPARMFAREEPESAPVELLVVDAGDSSRCGALIRPAKKVGEGMWLRGVETGTRLRVLSRTAVGSWEVEIEDRNLGWRGLLEKEGHMPLPPYILKRRAAKSDQPEDREWYQTAYADRDGAIAAPTAGLHFSTELLGQLEASGIESARVFLKVGLGTFQPVRTEMVEEHRLLPEEYELRGEEARRIELARQRGGRVVAVGTTAVRTLEFCADDDGSLRAGTGETGLLITPGHRFRVVDALITNFHLPKTTLLALVYAFGGKELMRRAYDQAVREKYRFFSYGDAMLIL